jgi:peptide chain release factor 1
MNACLSITTLNLKNPHSVKFKSLHSVRILETFRNSNLLLSVTKTKNGGKTSSIQPSFNVFSKATTVFLTTTSSPIDNLETILTPSIAQRVKDMSHQYDEIMASLVSSTSANNVNTKELSVLAPVSKLFREFTSIVEEIDAIRELEKQADELNDEEMLHECKQEIEEMNERLQNLGKKMIDAVLPKNEDDYSSDAVMEIRAGTGGDEACLFCSELMDAYENIAKVMGWKFEMLSVTKTDLGGVKEAAVSINGTGGGYSASHGSTGGSGSDDEYNAPNLGPYGFFKYESGVHRVQRVPVNDVRIHTSAASVAVLPAPSETSNKDELLPLSELKIETMRASGAGGQHVNTTDSAVRITHIPTGITASIQDERSQHKNRAKAIKLISARVRDQQQAEEARKRGEARNALLGGGDRSERIRTYNYPQDRITDHRCKHSEHGIEKLLAGGFDGNLVSAFAPFLRDMERRELLADIEKLGKK